MRLPWNSPVACCPEKSYLWLMKLRFDLVEKVTPDTEAFL